jgi:hypothetical protein
VQSRTFIRNTKPVYRLPQRDSKRRWVGQSTVPPPSTYREPITASAPPRTRPTIVGITVGSCEKSLSIDTMTSYPSSNAT